MLSPKWDISVNTPTPRLREQKTTEKLLEAEDGFSAHELTAAMI